MADSKRLARRLRWLARTSVVIVCIGVFATTGCHPADAPPAFDSKTAVQPAGGASPPSAEAGTPSGEPAASADSKQLSARQVLDRMAAAYKKASSYDDKGYVEIRYEVGGQKGGDQADYLVALAKPNKIRVQGVSGVAVSDGQKLRFQVMDVPDQVLQTDAPAKINVEALFPNYMVANALGGGPTQAFSWLPVQLVLLLADDPLKTLLNQSEEPVLLKPDKIGDRACHRVQIKRAEGPGVFWIDQETYALRRFEFPTEPLGTLIAEAHRVPRNEIKNLSLVAELQDAQFDGKIDPQAFEFQVPEEVQVVQELVPDALRWLGRKVPDFKFVGLDGSEITPQSLAGKVAVLDFWATWCQPCRMTLPDLEQVYQKLKDRPNLVFAAVSEDEASVTDQQLRDLFGQIGVNVPIARDPQETAHKALGIQFYPTTMVIDGQGVIQHRQAGGEQPGVGAARLTARLEKLLAGQSLYAETIQAYEKQEQAQTKRFEQMLQQCIKNDLYTLTAPQVPRAEIAARTEPKSLKLTPLWNCTELSAPGNILVLGEPDQAPRILVLEEAKSVAEIATRGNVASVKPLGVPQQEPVFFLRTAAGADGKRYFAGSSLGVQQVHLWDEGFNLLMSFPADAAQNPHAGIADVRIADLDGDGTPELAVSYFGVVGVQGVSLDGQRKWTNKSVVQSFRLAVLGPDAEGHRSLLAMNSPGDAPGTLAVLDYEGKTTNEFGLKDRVPAWIETDDLDGDGQPEICALASDAEQNVEAVGLNLEGQILWKYPMPPGMHEHEVEAVTAGKLLPGPTAQWILASADGTIHVLDAKGAPVDAFAYGKALTGVAAAEWDGKRVLLVSTAGSEGAGGSVDAWQVEPAGSP